MENPVLREMLCQLPKNPRIICACHTQSKRKYITSHVAKSLRKRGCHAISRQSHRVLEVLDDYDIVLTIGDASNYPSRHYNISDLIDRGKVYLHLDRGYLDFGKPISHYRVCVNSNQATKYIHAVDYSKDRFARLDIDVRAWFYCTNGRVMVCPVTQRHASLKGYDIKEELEAVIEYLHSEWDHQIFVKEKDNAHHSFIDLLHGTYAVVTWASNTAIEAVIHGKPVFLMDKDFVAEPFCSTDLAEIHDPKIVDREQYLYNLAYHQWPIDSILRAEFWDEIIAPYLP